MSVASFSCRSAACMHGCSSVCRIMVVFIWRMFPCVSFVATLYFLCFLIVFLSFRLRALYINFLCISFRICICSGCMMRNRCLVNVVANACRALFPFMVAKAMLVPSSAAASCPCCAAAGTFPMCPLVGRGAMRRRPPSRLSRRASLMLWCFCLFALPWCVCVFALLLCWFLFSLCCSALVSSLCCDAFVFSLCYDVFLVFLRACSASKSLFSQGVIGRSAAPKHNVGQVVNKTLGIQLSNNQSMVNNI